ncbi:MAG: ATP-binding protein, partial [Atopobiaceae bacterium]|nr:ATP-binding protein [Atopobiaceae bacterium]
QILLFMIGAVNGIVSSFFASNYVGLEAMSAVGLYAPLNMLLTSIANILVGGSAIIVGKYLGKHELKKVQDIFSLNLVLSFSIAAVLIALYVLMGLFDLSWVITNDATLRPIFNSHLLGQAIGILPLLLGNTCAAFLSLMNKQRRTLVASISYIVANVILNFIFVRLLQLEAFGLALASSLGLWVFLLVQAQAFLSKDSLVHIRVEPLHLSEALEVFRVGLPGAASYLYQSARGIILNHLLGIFVGAAGISAYAAANNIMNIFWAIPGGMLAVSRMLMSVSVGEEDRQTLTDIMRVMFTRYIPFMCVIAVGIIACSGLLSSFFFTDTSSDVFNMCAWGLRIIPICMPLSIICMHFTCYGQASDKTLLVHLLALLDGVVCVAGFTALLIPFMGMNSVYIANILNGVVTTLVVIAYSIIRNRRIPYTMDELMVIPEDFGVGEDERLDFSLKTLDDVICISDTVQDFCTARGISSRCTNYSALAMEEMGRNIIEHGFTKDSRKHSVDVRVAHKNEDVILLLRDDCSAFDPHERQQMIDPDDVLKNIGIRMVFNMADDVQYQNILGLNVLTIRMTDHH